MGIGISGMGVGAPPFVTGDPRKEYQFKFVLVPSSLSSSALVKSLKRPSFWFQFFSYFQMIYISSLVEQVDLPPSKVSLGSVAVGTLQQYPFFKGYETPVFSVVFLEDELESVYKFHKTWQDSTSNGGFLFEPLGSVCCKAIYMPVKRISLALTSKLYTGVDIPVGADVFPYVFPSEVRRSPANQGGSGVAKTTVIYTRVPDISKWNYSSREERSVSNVSRDEKG